MKAVVAAFNQEKALVGAFSVITNLRMEFFQALVQADQAAVQPHPRDRAAQRSHLLGPGAQSQEDGEQNQTEQVSWGLQLNVCKSKTIEKEVTIFDFWVIEVDNVETFIGWKEVSGNFCSV